MLPCWVPVEAKGICPSSAVDVEVGRSFSFCPCVTERSGPSSEDLTQGLPQASVNGDLAQGMTIYFIQESLGYEVICSKPRESDSS